MASTPGHGRIWTGNPISGRPSLDKNQPHPKYACGPLDRVYPFLTNGRCIEGRHASVIRRRAKSSNLRESKSRNGRDLHLEAIQREKSARQPTPMPALQLRISSGDSSLQKFKKKNRGSVLFFGRADHSADRPSLTALSGQLPPLYKLDNSSFLDLFQAEPRSPRSSAGSTCQRASSMPRLSIRPVESALRVKSSRHISPVSPPTPDKHPWSPDDAYANIQPVSTHAATRAPAAARSPSASSRGSEANDNGQYFSSSASQSSQSSVEDGHALPDSRSITDANPKYLAEPKEQVCDLEVVQRNPKRSAVGRRACSGILSRNKPLPSEPLVDIASPLFEIACPAVRAAPRARGAASETNQPDSLRPRRSSSASNRGRPGLPKLSTLSRGERLGLALTLHAQGMKIPNIVRHELPAQATGSGEELPASCTDSPISKLIAELENTSKDALESPHRVDGRSTDTRRKSSRILSHAAKPSARSTDHLRTDSAEVIILSILSLLDIQDLLSAARVSRGFYSVFKKYELRLIESTIFNTCPAAWECLEEPGKGSKVPARYLESYRTGQQTIAALRTTLLIRCDALLRQETISGLIRADKEVSKTIDQTFWRIWTFCEIFGHKSSRQDSTPAQVAWLRGDRASRTPTSTTPHLKRKRPLSSGELVDISEIWTCLASLLQNFHHQTSSARDAGLLDRCDIDETRNEEFYIKQWTAHVMTFGLSAILELSSCSFDDAKASGWTRWSPAVGQNGNPAFLADAVASVYQLRLIEEAEAEANKVALPRKASGRARSSRKRHTAHGDVLRIQTQNLPRKAVGSPPGKAVVAQPRHSSAPLPSQYDSCSPLPGGRHSASGAAAPPPATRRRSAASPAITASMFQALSLQPGASTQIGPTLFPARSPSPGLASRSTEPRPITPLSSIQSTPIALTRPERVPSRKPHLAALPEASKQTPPAPPGPSAQAAVSPTVDPTANATDLLVNDMGFPLATVQDALTSCDTGSGFDLDTVIAMLVSASSKPPTPPAMTATVKFVPPTELDSSSSSRATLSRPAPPPQPPQSRQPSQDAKRLVKKKQQQEKSAYSAQTKIAEFVEGSRGKDSKVAQRRHSKIKAFQVLGVSQERRTSTVVR